jgi:cysteine desulfurase/selenocysteine lyase
MEHHSNIVPWQQLAQRTSCRVKFLPITDDGQLVLDALDDFLTERTRLVSVVAVSNVLGTLNPISTIIQRAHEAGAVVLVDAAQSAPHGTTDVQAWDADFVALSGHKMLGPSGVGVLYGREAILEAMPPFQGGGSMIHRVTLEGFTPNQVPYRFEAGTPPIVPAIGLAAAVDYLQKIGLDHIHRYEQVLTKQAHEMLARLDGVRILGPAPSLRGGIVSLVVEGVQANDLAMAMDEQGVAVRAGHHCAMPLHARLGVSASTRASFYFYNTPEEVEKLGVSLQKALRLLRRTS